MDETETPAHSADYGMPEPGQPVSNMERVTMLRHWRSQDGRQGTRLYLWCPGCDDLHAVEIKDDRTRWEWDGNREAPTINPSILVNGGGDRHPRCHSYVRSGQWQFLGDCDHALAGQTVPMVALPAWLFEESTGSDQ